MRPSIVVTGDAMHSLHSRVNDAFLADEADDEWPVGGMDSPTFSLDDVCISPPPSNQRESRGGGTPTGVRRMGGVPTRVGHTGGATTGVSCMGGATTGVSCMGGTPTGVGRTGVLQPGWVAWEVLQPGWVAWEVLQLGWVVRGCANRDGSHGRYSNRGESHGRLFNHGDYRESHERSLAIAVSRGNASPDSKLATVYSTNHTGVFHQHTSSMGAGTILTC